MQGLAEFNKKRKSHFIESVSGSLWASEMNHRFDMGQPIWGGTGSSSSVSIPVAPNVPVPAPVDPLSEIVARYSTIPVSRQPIALSTTYFTPNQDFKIVGESMNQYLRLHSTFHRSTTSFGIDAPFMTPLFRTSLTAPRTVRGVFGIFQMENRQFKDVSGLGHTGLFPASFFSSQARPLSTGKAGIFVTASTDNGQLSFYMISYSATTYTSTILQTRLIDNRIRFNWWMGFARDEYNYYLYAFPTSSSSFLASEAVWVRLCTVAEFDTLVPDKFQVTHMWEADSYYGGTMYFEGSMQNPTL